ncbi:hypothetical protein BDV93DRAFT_612284 [Ceratobasidium sp. AG-I]|nr:hypothetical protein BDV93DRAFT_612284 [Ceratobasidium sp. AG-I]
MPYGGSGYSLFEVPELLALVCSHSSTAQCTRLARVSRSFFNTAVPFIWDKTVGAHNVLQLFPGTTVSRKKEEGVAPKYNYTIIMPVLEDINFDRFNCYAPFIKQLEIYPSDSRNYPIRRWEVLSVLAKQTTMLPNLVQLTLTNTFGITSEDQCIWIRTFLSPSLHSIEVVLGPRASLDDIPRIMKLAAVSLLQQIASNSPNLQHLALFPASYPADDPENAGYNVIESWIPSFYDCLHTLRLRELVCSTGILSPEHIHILSSLLNLESLEVYYMEDDIASVRVSPPPALKRFVQRTALWSDFEKIWELDLFVGLTSLDIFFEDDSPSDDFWPTKLITLICNASPVLESLCIEFGDMGFPVNTTTHLQPLAALPLRSVRLDFFVDIGEPIYNQAMLAWPMVTKLDLPWWDATLNELYLFARLPNLEHLVVSLRLQSLEVTLPPPTVKSLVLHTLESSNVVVASVTLSSLARHLVRLWPNIQQVIWVEKKTSEQRFGKQA